MDWKIWSAPRTVNGTANLTSNKTINIFVCHSGAATSLKYNQTHATVATVKASDMTQETPIRISSFWMPNETQTSRYQYRSSDELRKNQLRTTVGQAMSNPTYGTVGAGGVGIGTGTPFGNRFGAYADLLRRRISEKWRTNDVDPMVRNAKAATVNFDILRNGQVQNVRIVQSSGVSTLDFSARRAILDASPLPELPREFERSSANVEFTFQLQR